MSPLAPRVSNIAEQHAENMLYIEAVLGKFDGPHNTKSDVQSASLRVQAEAPAHIQSSMIVFPSSLQAWFCIYCRIQITRQFAALCSTPQCIDGYPQNLVSEYPLRKPVNLVQSSAYMSIKLVLPAVTSDQRFA